MKRIISLLHICTVFVLISYGHLSAQYIIKTHAFGNGVGVMTGTNFASGSTLGQTLTGYTTDNKLIAYAGFWFDANSYTALPWPEMLIPDTYSLSQNYPNPFNATTKITYRIPVAGWVSINIYNIRGQHVTTLVADEKQAGQYNLLFNAANLASGVYLYSFQINDYFAVKKMILTK